MQMTVASVGPYSLVSRTCAGAARCQSSTREAGTFSPPMPTTRTDGGRRTTPLVSEAVSSAQKAVGRKSTVRPHCSQRSQKAAGSSIASVRSTTVPPVSRAGKISSTLWSKLSVENWSTRSAGVSP